MSSQVSRDSKLKNKNSNQFIKSLFFNQLDSANISEFLFFENKTNVISEEIHAFLEIHAAFNSLENLVNQNLQSQKELRKEIDQISSSTKTTFGFIKQVTKETLLNELQDKLKKCDTDCEISSELFSIIANYLLEIEIPNFKANHHKKWNFILKNFSEERTRKLKAETVFWEKMNSFTNFE